MYIVYFDVLLVRRLRHFDDAAFGEKGMEGDS